MVNIYLLNIVYKSESAFLRSIIYYYKYVFKCIGILPQIVQSLKEERLNFKFYALSTLSEIAKHNIRLAKKIVEVQTLPNVICFLSTDYITDVKLQVYC